MQILEVNTKEHIQDFLNFPLEIYKNDQNWIRPLDKDIEDVFDPKKNKFFKTGEAKRWLLKNNNNQTIGRVATFINKKYKYEQPTGGIGFFECIDDQRAADFIFNHSKTWLSGKGMEAMDGPINFGERERWWGLQVEGFQEPLYCMNYNPAYYQQLFENYGFQPYFHQICYGLNVKDRLPEKFYTRHEEIAKDPLYKAIHLRKKNLEKFVKDFTYIYNKAWAGHGGGKELDVRTVRKMFDQMKEVLDEHITWFAYYGEEPIAMWINLPDLNQYFKQMNGKFGFWQKLYFLWLQKFGKCNRFVGLVFGIIPEFQGKGVDAFMIIEASKLIQPQYKYEKYEMQWIGDFNPKMINIAESLGTQRTRKLTTYRYLFDRSKPFQRHKTLS